MIGYKIFLIVGLYFILICNSSAQYKSLDFGLSVAPFFDDYKDVEYEYNYIRSSGLIHVPIGYTFSINEKMSLTPRIAYAYALSQYRKGASQLSQFPNTLPTALDSLTVTKNQIFNFFKTGVALTYWVQKTGRGLYVESELQNLTVLSANSRNTKQLIGGDSEMSKEDLKDRVRKSVPSLRVGIGYNLPIKQFSFFLRIGGEFRLSTYFKLTDSYAFLNRTIGFGFRYTLQNKVAALE